MVGELIAGRYELEELVGSGGMSSVYRAHDRLLERRVALKILHEQFTRDADYVERFRREARSVAQLAHPNIVTVIDRGQQDGRQFIVFEYVDGENLKQLVEREGPLRVDEAIDLALQVANALAFAHEQGLVHRDVKPQNVLLDGDGRAKVTDFGIARSLDVEGLTMTGTVMGSSNYIAPEQARGQPVDEQTDVYSLGCVLYELLTGEVPYSGDNFVAVAMKHINEPVPDVRALRPDVPPRLAAAIEQAIAKRPEDRPTMTELEAELRACHGAPKGAWTEEPATMIVPAAAAARAARSPGGRSRSRVWLAALALVALAVIAGALAATSFLGGGTAAKSKPRPRPAHPIRFASAAAYDPYGTGGEHDTAAKYVLDGNRATYWSTETYRQAQLGKPGVGLVLDAGRRSALRLLTVVTDTPRYRAEILSGDSPTGPFARASLVRQVNGTTAFPVHGAPRRYYVFWITDLGGNDSVHVNEVRAEAG